MIRTARIAALMLAAAPSVSYGSIINATAATFQSAMAKAQSGDTIKLSGSFGLTRLTGKNYASTVTIDATAASFSDTLILTNVSDLTVLGGHFGSTTAIDSYDKAVAVYGGSSISFVNPAVTGFYAGQGISFQKTYGASVTGASLSNLQAGIVFAGVTGGQISNSTSIASVSDGFDIVDSSHIDVGNNRCSGSTPTIGAHPDCVQMFSSAGAAPLDHIAIHDNDATGFTQGFDNFGSAPGDSYISIINNRVDGLMPQGIACYYCVNSTIRGNTITTLDGAPYQVALNVLYGSSNNVAANVIGGLNRSAAKQLVYYTRQQLSGGVVVTGAAMTGAVPEPAAWSMLIAGFGLIGFHQRARRCYVTA